MIIRQSLACMLTALCCVGLISCAGPREKKIEFVYLALGASDATGVGALPLTEGYVYVIKRELDQRMPGVFLMNLGVPGARIDLVKEQVRIAKQLGTKANLVTLWTGANDLVNGDDPKRFQEDLRALLAMVEDTISDRIVVANLPDLTMLPRFQTAPNPTVTSQRVAAFNRAIAEEAQRVHAPLVDLFASPVREDLVFDLDGFHPNNAGHRELARQFLAIILPALKLTQ
jgi:acyl-CoA thioesterase I